MQKEGFTQKDEKDGDIANIEGESNQARKGSANDDSATFQK
jgi:hypothetical protein